LSQPRCAAVSTVCSEKGADGYRSSLLEENKHQRVEAEGTSSRLRAANSITAVICSRSGWAL
jgi:hypothetical protein